MDDRVTRFGVIVLAVLGLASCQVSRARGGQGKGERLLASNRSAEAIEHFDREQALATDSLQRARAYLGMGRAQLKTGQSRAASTSFYSARDLLEKARNGKKRESAARRRQRRALETQVNRWIGEAYLDDGQFGLARRNLLRAFPGLQGAEREIVLAEIGFLSSDLGELDAATRYRRKLTRPYPGDVVGIVSGQSPRVAEARKKRLARRSEPTARSRQTVAVKEPKRTTRTQSRRQAPSTAKRRTPSHEIRILGRSSWNARAPKTSRLKPMGKISRITVHHSAGKTFWAHSREDTARHIRSIQRYHQDEKKWADIGYHYVIDRAGIVWQGRSRSYQGAHAGGAANRGNIGIVVLGNYTRQEPHREQIRSLANLVGQLSDRHGVPHYRVYTHKELQPGHTACPGPALTRVVGQIRGKLRERHLAMGKNVDPKHDHQHVPDGEPGRHHGDHVDCLHDAHLRAIGEVGNVVEHQIEVTDIDPAVCTPDHSCRGHAPGRVHRRECGHEPASL